MSRCCSYIVRKFLIRELLKWSNLLPLASYQTYERHRFIGLLIETHQRVFMSLHISSVVLKLHQCLLWKHDLIVCAINGG